MRVPERFRRPPGAQDAPRTLEGAILETLGRNFRHAVCEVAGFGGAAPCEIYSLYSVVVPLNCNVSETIADPSIFLSRTYAQSCDHGRRG